MVINARVWKQSLYILSWYSLRLIDKCLFFHIAMYCYLLHVNPVHSFKWTKRCNRLVKVHDKSAMTRWSNIYKRCSQGPGGALNFHFCIGHLKGLTEGFMNGLWTFVNWNLNRSSQVNWNLRQFEALELNSKSC